MLVTQLGKRTNLQADRDLAVINAPAWLSTPIRDAGRPRGRVGSRRWLVDAWG